MSIRCPRCGSEDVSGGTQGFGAGKAVVGAVVAGPLGLAAGAINKNKVTNSCMTCGHRWQPEKPKLPAQENDWMFTMASVFCFSFAGMIGWWTGTEHGFLWGAAAAIAAFIVAMIVVITIIDRRWG